jgi:DNA repair exonuclease SbcCD ATPase subunit
MDTNKNQILTPEVSSVEDGEVVGEVKGGMNIVELTALINRYEGDMKKMRDNLKIQAGMLRDAVEGDAAYHELDTQSKDLQKKKTEIKQKVMKTQAMEAVVAKIEEYKSEIKDAKDMLSGYLEEYQRVAGTNIIEGENGEIKEIVPQYRLVKRNNG